MRWLPSRVKEVIVYKSNSVNVWANLALEDWILKNVDLTTRRILLLWRNTPCVVIGRHQNPWLETNIPLIRKKGVVLARRRSGGGAVYQDLGNLNITVFTHRHDYNRPRNLELVCDAINEGWGTNLHRNERDDILYNGYKVSGSSARLVKDSVYHHFTLLLDVNTSNLHSFLEPHPKLHLSHSIATASKRSKVKNLCLFHWDMSCDSVVASIADRFYHVHAVVGDRKVVEVDPSSETDFPGISKMQSELQQWGWLYGKTPKFSLETRNRFNFGNLEFYVEIVGGVIQSTTIHLSNPTHSMLTEQEVLKLICSKLEGQRFWSKDIASSLGTMDGSHVRDITTWLTEFT